MVEFVGGWQPIATGAAVLSLLLVGCAYALGNLFQSDRMKAWAKNEFVQAIASAIIIGALIAVAAGLEGAAFDLAGKNHVAFALEYLQDFGGSIDRLYAALIAMNVVVSALAKASITLSAGVISGGTQPLAGLAPISQGMEMVLFGLNIVRISNDVQYWLLVFIESTMFYYFLPVGVVLRTFPCTRSAGGFMMALAIGLYIVFPLTYVLADQSMDRMNARIDEAAGKAKDFFSDSSAVMVNLLNVAGLSTIITDLVVKGVWDAAIAIVSMAWKAQADMVAQAIILPLVGMVTTLVFITGLSKTLSAEW